jgi:hypothetical protein
MVFFFLSGPFPLQAAYPMEPLQLQNPISQASAFFAYPKEKGRQEGGKYGISEEQTKSESD